MSKPKWKDAPECVEWLAQDRSGDWYWYLSEPYADLEKGHWFDGANQNNGFLAMEGLIGFPYDWEFTLERRP